MLKEFIRYNIVGIINTLVGFSIIFLLMLLGLSPIVSNIIGYSIGAILSYHLNSRYTFQKNRNKSKRVFKFFLVLTVAFGLNFLTLLALLPYVNPYFAQVLSAIVYTLSSFLFMKLFVFR